MTGILHPTILPPTEEEYRRDKISTALSYCPTIRPCKKCGWAVMDGYCCGTCKTGTPEEPLTAEEALEILREKRDEKKCST